MRLQLAQALAPSWQRAFEANQVSGPYRPDAASAGRRSLANLALAMLCLAAAADGDAVWPGRAYQRFKDAANMTDRFGALAALVDSHADLAQPALERFHQLFRNDALVIDKWFALQVTAPERDGRVFGRAQAAAQASRLQPAQPEPGAQPGCRILRRQPGRLPPRRWQPAMPSGPIGCSRSIRSIRSSRRAWPA